MISTLEITEAACRTTVDKYLGDALGATYRVGQAQLRNGYWYFTVTNQRADMQRIPAVGSIAVDAVSGEVKELTQEQIRNMREAGAVQAAQERKELARDEDGYVLRRHARIKANCWISDRVGMKIGAENGLWVAQEPPVWRFSIVCYLCNVDAGPLGSIEVDALTGQVMLLTDTQIQSIQEAVSAAIRYQSRQQEHDAAV